MTTKPSKRIMTDPRVLTVRQPFASLIIGGHKDVENRRWQTSYRGPLLIHAGLARESLHLCKSYAKQLKLPPEQEPPLGAILGAVMLTQCRPYAEMTKTPWAKGPWCWMLEGPLLRLDTPFPCTGQLGLWLPPLAFWKEHSARCDHCKRRQNVLFAAAEHLCGKCGKIFPVSWVP